MKKNQGSRWDLTPNFLVDLFLSLQNALHSFLPIYIETLILR